MTHLDTFDPKTGTETGGPTQTIKTNADGVQLAENLPLLANHADKIAVVRGMSSTKGLTSRVIILCIPAMQKPPSCIRAWVHG